MAQFRKRNLGKAGLSGLFLLALTAFAFAEPLRLQIESAKSEIEKRTGQLVVSIKYKREPAFDQFTQANVGKLMRALAGGRTIYQGVIREPLLGTSFQISGMTAEEAGRMADEFSKARTIEVELVDVTQYSPAPGPLSPDASKN